MGFSTHKIQKKFNDIVGMYKAMGFTEVPYSVIAYNPPIMRSIDLTKDGNTIRVKLCNNAVPLKGSQFGVACYDLEADLHVNNKAVATELLNRFYYVAKDYYTTDVSEVSRARSIHMKRLLSDSNNSSKAVFLDKNKLSHKVMAYLRNIIEPILEKENHPCQYSIYDVYFTHVRGVRNLVIVYKNCDRNATEAIFFEPKHKAVHYTPFNGVKNG